MRKVTVTLVIGIALVIAVGARTLTRSPPRVVGVSGRPADASLGYTIGGGAICQAHEVLPGGATAIRLSVLAFFGPKVRAILYRGSRVLTEGRRGPTWTGSSVTVPLESVARTNSHLTLCLELGPGSERLDFPGRLTRPQMAAVAWRSRHTPTPALAASEGRILRGRIGVEYLAPGRGSWWSRGLSVARHMGIGHFISGTWVALLLAALMAIVVALAVGLAMRELP
jgi:hypothetical protein